jgi:hypothetical protein
VRSVHLPWIFPSVVRVDCTVVLQEDEAFACRVVTRRCPLLEGRPTIDLFAASRGCFRGDRMMVCHCDEGARPTAGQPCLPLRKHGVTAELELVKGPLA